MRDDTKTSFWDSWARFKEMLKESVRRKVVVRQKFGGEVFTLPLLVAILIAVIALKFVLIGILVLILVGYRISLERR